MNQGLEGSVADSIAYLESAEARQSLERDPYWPKWDSPWWHMTLLWELGMADRIPRSIVGKMVAAFDSHYLKFFPLSEKDIPEGADVYRHFPCHCGLGTMYQVLTACGVRMDAELPWVRPWFLKYQLPDGGLNCDERAYSKPTPKSSIVSTLPPLEAILFCTDRPLTEEEGAFLDRGARYLIAHRLFRSATNGRIIDENWLKPCFPRFYEYDILRGMRFLVCWAEIRKQHLPSDAVGEALDLLSRWGGNGVVKAERLVWGGAKTKAFGMNGEWSTTADQPASAFDLLREVSQEELSAPALSGQWMEIQQLFSAKHEH